MNHIKDDILEKITPEVKDTDEPADKKDDILSEVLPIKSAVDGKDSKLTTEEAAAVTKSEVLDIKETKHVGDLSEPEQQLVKDHVAQSKDESSKSTSDTKLEDTIHEKQEKVPVDLSKKSIEEIKFEIKETMVSDPSDIKKEKSDISDEEKHTRKSEDIKDDILRKSANIITDATFTTTDVKSSLSKTDDQDLTPVSDKLTRAVADEKILEKEEQILEKPADDLRQTFETVSDLTEHIIFDKCDKPSSKVEVVDEKLPKDEEKCLEGITEACETVAEITKSVIFDKSEKHPTEIETMDEKKLKEKDSDKSTENLKSLTFDKCGISTELDEIDPNILEEEKTARKKVC
ncbi:hypothetical protein NQ314_003857 [Rhamnusium bicolor]|uniref:Uncharacterized protein n=1 Tax=Rhamnusium bicolor TaxID=1586634 RepID=A0AAV8ZNP2_9CUCU|nr:hypothetical protein NQ314_003857 [Rhamnusium bicolor]